MHAHARPLGGLRKLIVGAEIYSNNSSHNSNASRLYILFLAKSIFLIKERLDQFWMINLALINLVVILSFFDY